MAFCIHCGAELTGNYCTQCGQPSGSAPRNRQGNAKTVLKWVLISFGTLLGILVLTAIILPLVVSTNGPGHLDDVGWAEVQSAIDIMMVDNDMTVLTANDTAAKITSTTDLGGGQLITEYLRDLPTEYCYTWTTVGVVTQADCP